MAKTATLNAPQPWKSKTSALPKSKFPKPRRKNCLNVAAKLVAQAPNLLYRRASSLRTVVSSCGAVVSLLLEQMIRRGPLARSPKRSDFGFLSAFGFRPSDFSRMPQPIEHVHQPRSDRNIEVRSRLRTHNVEPRSRAP